MTAAFPIRLGAEPGTAEQKAPQPWLVLAAPGAVFQAVAEGARPRRALRALLLMLPLMPLIFAVVVHDSIRTTLLEDPALVDRAGAAGYLAVLAGLVICLVQVAMMVANYALFAVSVRLVGRVRATHRTLIALWAYAAFPLVLRQICYAIVVAVMGPDWVVAHASLIGTVDPFLIAVAILFFLGCRKALGLSRARSAVVTVLTTLIGLVGVFLSGVSL
ncbi:YIP1 family protein [Streptomyces solincola]|uniref:YIP1 family protein n=1 Tax=Streptomyces solincola TaxID=2100817 RepID=UPI0015E38E13|nr:YIP1 family protein [Streptomyces solincola]